MSRKDQNPLYPVFWAAPDAAVFERPYVAAALMRSVAWLRALEAKGNGPRRLSVGTCLYKKGDVVAWLSTASTLDAGVSK